jgi:hypothetical protein
MKNKIYLTRGSRWIDSDPARGLTNSYTDYSGFYAVIAENEEQANKKFLKHYEDNFRPWEDPQSEEITSGKLLPLEWRVKIISEVLKKQNRVDSVIR